MVNDGQPQKAVFYASTKDGRTFTPRARLSRTDLEEAAHPQIAFASSGGVGVVWDPASISAVEGHPNHVNSIILDSLYLTALGDPAKYVDTSYLDKASGKPGAAH